MDRAIDVYWNLLQGMYLDRATDAAVHYHEEICQKSVLVETLSRVRSVHITSTVAKSFVTKVFLCFRLPVLIVQLRHKLNAE